MSASWISSAILASRAVDVRSDDDMSASMAGYREVSRQAGRGGERDVGFAPDVTKKLKVLCAQKLQ